MRTPAHPHRECGAGGPSTTATTSSSSSSSNSTADDGHRHHPPAGVGESHPSKVGEVEEDAEKTTYYAEITTTVSDFHRPHPPDDAEDGNNRDRRDEFRRDSSCSSYGSVLSLVSASDLSCLSSGEDEDAIMDAILPLDVEAGGGGGGRRRSSLVEGGEEDEWYASRLLEDDGPATPGNHRDPPHARHPQQQQQNGHQQKYGHYVQCSSPSNSANGTPGGHRTDPPSGAAPCPSQQQRQQRQQHHGGGGGGSTAAAIAAASASSRRRALLCLMGLAFATVNALVRFVAARGDLSTPPATVAAESDFPSSRQQWSGDITDATADVAVADASPFDAVADDGSGSAAVARPASSTVVARLNGNDVDDELRRGASPYWDNLADVTEQLREGQDAVPFFFHVMRCGGAMVENVLAICGGLTVAAQAGSTGGRGDAEELEVVQMPSGGKYVNVDLTTMDGVARAARLDLAGPLLRPDVLFSPHPYEVASTVFDARRGRRGRMFAVFRHPMERAASLFAFKRSSPGGGGGGDDGDGDGDGDDGGSARDAARDPRLAGMTLEQYADSEFVENNWMVRFLTNAKTEKLSKEHLHLAREILRRKCLVGLLSQIEESMERFERYFGWTFADSGPRRECRDYLLEHGENRNTDPVPKVEEGSEAWDLLMRHNTLDMQLYSYVEQLWKEQGNLFP